jgi:predicted metal-dependent TIM-barrel fold hydrolase
MTYKGFTLRTIKSKATRRTYIIAEHSDGRIICGDYQDSKALAVADVKAKIDAKGIRQ